MTDSRCTVCPRGPLSSGETNALVIRLRASFGALGADLELVARFADGHWLALAEQQRDDPDDTLPAALQGGAARRSVQTITAAVCDAEADPAHPHRPGGRRQLVPRPSSAWEAQGRCVSSPVADSCIKDLRPVHCGVTMAARGPDDQQLRWLSDQ